MTAEISLYELLNRLDRFGGVERLGQAGFCLWMALMRKSNRLGWARTFSMTNAELIFTGGFSSEKALWQVRNKLVQMGLFEYESPARGKTLPGRYTLNFNFDQEFPEENNNCFPIENSLEAVGESLWNQLGSSLGNINKQNKDNNDNNNRALECVCVVSEAFGRVLTAAEQDEVSGMWQMLFAACGEQALPLWHEAVRRTAANGVTKVSYVKRILKNWLTRNIVSIEQAVKAEADFSANRRKGGRVGAKAIKGARFSEPEDYNAESWEQSGFSVSRGS